jgi:hypothetical protein
MHLFCRQNVIKTAVSYSEYLQDPERQENYICGQSRVDWQAVADFELPENNQARCFKIALPNTWIDPNKTPDMQNEAVELVKKRVRKLIVDIWGEDKYNNNEIDYHVHYNNNLNNLHVHVLYSERSLQAVETEIIGIYKKNVWHTADGKVAKIKTQRARDEHGNELPPVHVMGEAIVKQGAKFGVKDKKYKTKGWLRTAKLTVKERLQSWGVYIDEPNPLAQKHEGKGNTPISILNRQYNRAVKSLNKVIESIMSKGHVFNLDGLKTAMNEDYNARVLPYWESQDWNKIDISTPLKIIDKEDFKRYYRKMNAAEKARAEAARQQERTQQWLAQHNETREARVAEEMRIYRERVAEEAVKKEREAEEAQNLQQSKTDPKPAPVPVPQSTPPVPVCPVNKVTSAVSVNVPPSVKPSKPAPPQPAVKPKKEAEKQFTSIFDNDRAIKPAENDRDMGDDL